MANTVRLDIDQKKIAWSTTMIADIANGFMTPDLLAQRAPGGCERLINW